LLINAADKFQSIYGYDPVGMSFCPYRVCPLGAHIDHQQGNVMGFALDRGIHIAYSPAQNGEVALVSLQFSPGVRFPVNGAAKQNDWADYLRGATEVLGKRYSLEVGLCGLIDGNLPIGGLSSSAAVIIAFLQALCAVNGIHLSPTEIIQIALETENIYVGVRCGKLDPACEVLAKKNHLLYLDTQRDFFELIPRQGNMKPFEIAVLFSGIERSLVGSVYNKRVDECRAAADALLTYEGMDCKNHDEIILRNVSQEVFNKHKNKLPIAWRNRAAHFYTEMERVDAAVAAWRKGDIETMGRLCFESGESSIVLYKSGSEELTALYNIMRKTEGIYGGRFSGAGLGGCCMALVDPAYKEYITKTVSLAYAKKFPALAGKFSIHFCQSGDGVGYL